MKEQPLSFINCINKTNIETHKLVLNKYKSKFDDIVNLKDETPIFLDANVLLKSYSISFEARANLLKFYQDFKSKIFISQQVQIEFTKNREDIIERFFEDVTKGLPDSFNKNIINHFKSFLENNKTILVDYKDFEKKLQQIESELTKLSDSLNNDTKQKKDENRDILLNDAFLEIFSQCKCLESNSELIDKAKKDFNDLKKTINLDKIDSEIKKIGKAFPGLGDIKQKPDNPYGDFILYYELMEFAKSNKKDIIFLTYDTTKGDWMKMNKQPHIHYIENFYLNTGQIIYILDAKRIFQESLKIDFTSLINLYPENHSNSKITKNSLNDFLQRKFLDAFQDDETLINNICDELIYNGYESFEKLENDLDRAENGFQQYISDECLGENKFTKVGNLRIRLKILNKNYHMKSNTEDKFFKSKQNLYDKYGNL